MGKYYCCMPNCHNYSGKIGKFERNVTLHKLPKDVSTRRAWIRAISRKHWKPTDYTRVCSDHFSEGIGPQYLQRLKVPTENLAQKVDKLKPTPRSNRLKRKLTASPDHGNLFKSESADASAQRTNRQLFTSDENEIDYDSTIASKEVEFLHSYSLKRDEMPHIEAMASSSTVLTQSREIGVQNIPESKKSHYSLKRDEMPHIEAMASSSTVSTQSREIGVQNIPETHDANLTTCRPEITIEDIKDSDEKIQFYTGLTNFQIFYALFSTLMDFRDNTIDSDLGRKHKLRPVDEFLLVMMRLRLGLLVKDLEFRFKVASSTVSKIFNAWIVFMYKYLQSIVFLPKLNILQKRVPNCFRLFNDTRIILDCTEIFVQTPSSLENQSLTYSNYKSHNTFKVLVGVNMTGAVVFMSKLWGGSASDVEITRQSGLLELLDSGDAVMVDKGFIHLKSDLAKRGVRLYCPPFKTKEQFSKEEVDFTRRIASARIHVERKMEQIKNFRILQGVMPLAINNKADEIVFVCGALTNLLPPLIS